MYKQTCMKNGCEWNSYLENPKQCPKCHRSDWRRPRKASVSLFEAIKTLEIKQSTTLPWFFDAAGKPDEKKNISRQNMIIAWAKKNGKQFTILPISDGISVYRRS